MSDSLHKALQAGIYRIAVIDMRLNDMSIEYFKLVENVVVTVDGLNMYVIKDIS